MNKNLSLLIVLTTLAFTTNHVQATKNRKPQPAVTNNNNITNMDVLAVFGANNNHQLQDPATVQHKNRKIGSKASKAQLKKPGK